MPGGRAAAADARGLHRGARNSLPLDGEGWVGVMRQLTIVPQDAPAIWTMEPGLAAGNVKLIGSLNSFRASL